MIPKIIHYSWFSGDPYPEWIEDCIRTWKELLRDYEFVLWDRASLAQIDSPFVHEAVSVRKWAFAADYVRLYALYHQGGVWLDTDVEMFRPLDAVLDCDMFIGKESWPDSDGHVYLTSHCFGSVPGHPFVKECLDYYTDRHFILPQSDERGTAGLDMTTISRMQAEKARAYGFDWEGKHMDKSQTLSNGVRVYPSYCFCRPQYTSMNKVFCIHRCAGAWRDKEGDGRSLTDPKTMTLKIRVWSILHKLHLK